MAPLLTAAFVCHFLALLVSVGFGLTYLFRREFLPYHAIALGAEWRSVPEGMQYLILAFMRAVAGGTLATSLLTGFVLFVPFRAGETWALWAVALGGGVLAVGSLCAMRILVQHTPARPPVKLVFAGLGLVMFGFALSLMA